MLQLLRLQDQDQGARRAVLPAFQGKSPLCFEVQIVQGVEISVLVMGYLKLV